MLEIEEFLKNPGVILDVRSPSEYEKGHIPGAQSLPLFSDMERHHVGICYKQEGKEKAIEMGIELVGPKLSELMARAKSLVGNEKKARVYCWRGGMRSNFVHWFLNFLGIQTEILLKGYKSYRRYALELFSRPYSFKVLGGYTGVGKTDVLQELQKRGKQIIDLESLAQHRGSAFGLVPGIMQPTQEHFENLLANALHQLDNTQPIWLEDESRKIGSVHIHDGLFSTIKESDLYFLSEDREKRIAHIVNLYSSMPKEYLVSCVYKLQKKLGLERANKAAEYIEKGDFASATDLLLYYYDENYHFALHKYQRTIFEQQKGEFLAFNH